MYSLMVYQQRAFSVFPAGFAASSRIIEGTMRRGGQYHFHLETQVSSMESNLPLAI